MRDSGHKPPAIRYSPSANKNTPRRRNARPSRAVSREACPELSRWASVRIENHFQRKASPAIHRRFRSRPVAERGATLSMLRKVGPRVVEFLSPRSAIANQVIHGSFGRSPPSGFTRRLQRLPTGNVGYRPQGPVWHGNRTRNSQILSLVLYR